jgi:hypothetical protein
MRLVFVLIKITWLTQNGDYLFYHCHPDYFLGIADFFLENLSNSCFDITQYFVSTLLVGKMIFQL